jgi:RNase P/RNase MRP subunit POP5
MVRFKQRYLLITVYSDSESAPRFTQKDVYSAISGEIMRTMGVWGYGIVKATLKVKYWNPDTGMCIMRFEPKDLPSVVFLLRLFCFFVESDEIIFGPPGLPFRWSEKWLIARQ